MNISFYKNQSIKKDDIPYDVLFILKKLKDSGFWSFLVGGCVRDLLLKRTVRDWDIITDARPSQIELIFREYKTLIIGKSFHTVALVLNHKMYQISSFWNKGTLYLGDQQGKLFRILQNDLICRDFTINAMAWNQGRGLLDPSKGLQDLSQKVLRSISPDKRFKEDPLRMLRAVRIASELDFTMSAEIKKSLIQHNFLISHVSAERIRNELYYIFKSYDTKRGILLLQQFGLDRYIFSLDQVKKIQVTKKERKENYLLLSGLDNLKKDLVAQLVLWGRLYFGSCQAARMFYFPVVKFLKFTKRTIERIKILLSTEWQDVDFSSSIQIRFLIAQFGRENIELLMSLKKILLSESNQLQQNQLKIEERLLREELGSNNPVELSDLAIDGNDLINMGLSEGKEIGDILRIIFKKVLVNPKNNNKDILVQFVQDIIKDKGKIEKRCN
jgi:tRNA nucleotidyltransferase (CCA-adding enzyme)